MRKCEVIFDVAKRRARVTELERRTAAPDFWNDANKARELLDQVARERTILDPVAALERRTEDAAVLMEMADGEADAELARAAAAETAAELQALNRDLLALELTSMLSGPRDRNNAFLTIHAGAGGTEACDWAAMLLRMIRRYCESKGFKVDRSNSFTAWRVRQPRAPWRTARKTTPWRPLPSSWTK